MRSLRRLGVRSFGSSPHHDVLVIGGGHAGCEAAAAAARVGASTALITHKKETIGVMSCNPSIGGIGKGVLVKEIDALDGLMGRVIDKSGVQFRVLNKSKGPAVHGPRAQADRELYRTHMQQEIASQENLSVIESAVEDLIVEAVSGASPGSPITHRVSGVVLGDGREVRAGSVVVCTGTFLKGALLIGPTIREIGGRRGDGSAIGLSDTLTEKLQLSLGRLITGTPPRILKESIDFKSPGVEASPGDTPPLAFSFMNRKEGVDPSVRDRQIPTYFTFTNKATHEVVKAHMHLLPTFQPGVRGPRYCPSIENKVRRFPDRIRHQIWLEPEGFDNDLVYPNGLNNGFPPDIQTELVRTIPGLEKAVLTQPGYAVEYDYVDPKQLDPTLRVSSVQGLFLAGQINGTTGYEEAGSQGIIAGINAALAAGAMAAGEGARLAASEGGGLVLDRADGYTGVLIDDLVTKGASEPYRMFTSRSEYRLLLRPENADRRLTPKGISCGVVGRERREMFESDLRDYDHVRKLADSIVMTGNGWHKVGVSEIRAEGTRRSITDLVRSGLHLDTVLERIRDRDDQEILGDYTDDLARAFEVHPIIREAVSIDCQYSLYTEKQRAEVARMRRQRELPIPEDTDYASLRWFSAEEVEKLSKERPKTIGEANRIMGITPASMSFLLAHCVKADKLLKKKRQGERAKHS
mmetsp:Transcript_9793/g.19139  ORF Transcript_9793/g.19139 Transcript_9793/m.19139 type:complete len:693 (-) Transcript_9793:170-2248(-)